MRVEKCGTSDESDETARFLCKARAFCDRSRMRELPNRGVLRCLLGTPTRAGKKAWAGMIERRNALSRRHVHSSKAKIEAGRLQLRSEFRCDCFGDVVPLERFEVVLGRGPMAPMRAWAVGHWAVGHWAVGGGATEFVVPVSLDAHGSLPPGGRRGGVFRLAQHRGEMRRRYADRHQFIDEAPDQLEAGILYVSMPYRTTLHLCCCGCGNQVALPLRPTAWKLTYDGDTITMSPSVGNWSFPAGPTTGSATTRSSGQEHAGTPASKRKAARRLNSSRITLSRRSLPDHEVGASSPTRPPTPTKGRLRCAAWRIGGISVHQSGEVLVVTADDWIAGVIRSVWEETLDPDRSLYDDDDFFEMGGDSFLVVAVIDRVEAATGRRVPIPLLFDAPTLRAFTAAVRALDG
jgi:hypothetical protein